MTEIVNCQDQVVAEMLKSQPKGTSTSNGVEIGALEYTLEALIRLNNRAWRKELEKINRANKHSSSLDQT